MFDAIFSPLDLDLVLRHLVSLMTTKPADDYILQPTQLPWPPSPVADHTINSQIEESLLYHHNSQQLVIIYTHQFLLNLCTALDYALHGIHISQMCVITIRESFTVIHVGTWRKVLWSSFSSSFASVSSSLSNCVVGGRILEVK